MSSNQSGLPGSLMLYHGIENGQELMHTRGESDFLGLASLQQTQVERAQKRVVAGGDQRRHVQRRPDASSPSPDDPVATVGPRIMVKRSLSGQRRPPAQAEYADRCSPGRPATHVAQCAVSAPLAVLPW